MQARAQTSRRSSACASRQNAVGLFREFSDTGRDCVACGADVGIDQYGDGVRAADGGNRFAQMFQYVELLRHGKGFRQRIHRMYAIQPEGTEVSARVAIADYIPRHRTR